MDPNAGQSTPSLIPDTTVVVVLTSTSTIIPTIIPIEPTGTNTRTSASITSTPSPSVSVYTTLLTTRDHTVSDSALENTPTSTDENPSSTDPSGSEVSDINDSSSSTSAAHTSSIGSTNGNNDSGGLSTGVKIALGVAIPVGVLAILTLIGVIFWKRHQKAKAIRSKRLEEVRDYSYNPNIREGSEDGEDDGMGGMTAAAGIGGGQRTGNNANKERPDSLATLHGGPNAGAKSSSDDPASGNYRGWGPTPPTPQPTSSSMPMAMTMTMAPQAPAMTTPTTTGTGGSPVATNSPLDLSSPAGMVGATGGMAMAAPSSASSASTCAQQMTQIYSTTSTSPPYGTSQPAVGGVVPPVVTSSSSGQSPISNVNGTNYYTAPGSIQQPTTSNWSQQPQSQSNRISAGHTISSTNTPNSPDDQTLTPTSPQGGLFIPYDGSYGTAYSQVPQQGSSPTASSPYGGVGTGTGAGTGMVAGAGVGAVTAAALASSSPQQQQQPFNHSNNYQTDSPAPPIPQKTRTYSISAITQYDGNAILPIGGATAITTSGDTSLHPQQYQSQYGQYDNGSNSNNSGNKTGQQQQQQQLQGTGGITKNHQTSPHYNNNNKNPLQSQTNEPISGIPPQSAPYDPRSRQGNNLGTGLTNLNNNNDDMKPNTTTSYSPSSSSSSSSMVGAITNNDNVPRRIASNF